MGYTMSFDASVKVKAADVKGWLRHAARDVDLQNGVETRHANPNIDGSMTSQNTTLVYNQQTRSFEQASSVDQIEKSLQERLSHVKKPLRKDAVVARTLVLQLDPEFYEDYSSDDDKTESYDAMTEWAIKTFGEQNLVCMSVHEDESNPHVHLLFTPVTEDGRLSQKDWFPNPGKLREMHQDLRQHMIDAGYEIDVENRKPGKHAKRIPDAEYRDFAKLKEESKMVDTVKASVSRREVKVKKDEREIAKQKKALEAREAACKALEAEQQRIAAAQAKRAIELDQRAEKLDERETGLTSREQAVAARWEKVKHLERVQGAAKLSVNRRLPDGPVIEQDGFPTL